MASPTIQPGTVIDGKYRVLRRIGEGGMGTVYEGENVRIQRRVAIKVLHAHVASSPEFAQRFEREALASARIGSPHVCDVLDLGDFENGDRFIVMEYLEGESFEERLTRGKLTAQDLAPIAFEILDGLGTMHQAGVIHRDLKPANVFLVRRPNARAETVKILDFGVAKLIPRADEPSNMTSTGTMMGTPLYMSPEQARGARDVDGRTDLYAASVMFYRALTAEMPHIALNLHELLFKIVLEDPRPIRELVPDIDEEFAAIVTKGLARDADQRFATARDYQEAIAAWGRKQGRASLQFAVTLASDPPPPININGGYPMAAIKAQTPVTGPPLGSPRAISVGGTLVGPPTPSESRGLLDANKTAALATPSTKQQSGGTPIVWSDDAPAATQRAAAELEARRVRGIPGATALLEPSPFRESPSTGPPPPTQPPAARRQGAGMRAVFGVGAIVVVATAAVGARFALHPTASAKVSGSASAVSDPTSTGIAAPPATSPIASVDTSPPEPEASASTSTAIVPTASPPSTRVVHATATAPAWTAKPSPSISVAKSAAPATPPPAPSPTAPPAPTTSHRKFRTNLE